MDAKRLLARFDPRRSEAQREATHRAVAAGSALTGSYLLMNAAATVMAGLGLLQNSAVVIIGAMLIAMLFGPIVGIAPMITTTEFCRRPSPAIIVAAAFISR